MSALDDATTYYQQTRHRLTTSHHATPTMRQLYGDEYKRALEQLLQLAQAAGPKVEQKVRAMVIRDVERMELEASISEKLRRLAAILFS
ncbi:hypothetical protein [Kitasatospora acidiphila]|uniref:hypothetical protein n=1 Tax=Kitasatospora acidiphila TaxID=2567942 RepID=UPI003C763C99